MRKIKPAGLSIEDVVIGEGSIVQRGSRVRIHFRLSLNRGDIVQDTRVAGEPYELVIGSRHAIAGLERGLIGMRVGGRRLMVVAPHLAYGAAGIPNMIPPNAIVHFDVELLSVAEKSRPKADHP